MMLDSYKKTMLVLVLISTFYLSLINYFEVSELTMKFQVYNYSTTITNYIDDNILINLTGFKFIINPKICKKLYTTDLFVIVTIPSFISNYDHRRAIRQTWGSRWDDNIKVVFFVGLPETNIEEETRRVRLESDIFGDIIQGNIIDGYKNLTYKHVMILKWVAQFCTQAHFVLKADDDVVVDLYRMYNLLEEYKWGRSGVMACHARPNVSVKRIFNHLVVSSQEFSEPFYPPHCSGFTIVYSSDVVIKLLEASRKVPYFFVEDVYVTGLLAKKAGIRATDFGIPSLNERLALLLISNPSRLRGEGPYVLGPFFSNWQRMQNFWIPLQRYNFRVEKINRLRNVTFYRVYARHTTKTFGMY